MRVHAIWSDESSFPQRLDFFVNIPHNHKAQNAEGPIPTVKEASGSIIMFCATFSQTPFKRHQCRNIRSLYRGTKII